MSFEIFKSALSSLSTHFGAALKVSLGPLVLGIMSIYAIINFLAPMLGWWTVLVAFIAGLFVFSWIAAAWHRVILLDEPASFVPQVPSKQILRYLGKTVWTSIVILIPVFVLLLIVAVATGASINVDLLNPLSGSTTFAIVLNVFFGVVFSFLWLLLAVGLPATAVGKPMTLRQVWRETSPYASDIAVLAVLQNILTFALSYATGLFVGLGLTVSSGVSILAVWIGVMVGVSILTELYRRVIQTSVA